MNSELRARFERLGPVRAIVHDRLFSAETEAVVLERTGTFDRRLDVARRLFVSGMSMKAAHATITRLAAEDWAVVEIPVDGGIDELARDLRPLDVRLSRRRQIDAPAAFIADVRTRHDLSQREFAAALGLDVRTLQNWEQGRNRPDAAVLTLVALFDRDRRLVEQTIFEPVP